MNGRSLSVFLTPKYKAPTIVIQDAVNNDSEVAYYDVK